MDGRPPVNLLEQLLAQEWAEEQPEREARRAARGTPDAKKKFRSSLAWRRTRYKVLAANAKKYGQVTCELCKSIVGPFHVDHELPISTEEGWLRRFDVDVLRVCCADCNTGRLASPISLERPNKEPNDEFK